MRRVLYKALHTVSTTALPSPYSWTYSWPRHLAWRASTLYCPENCDLYIIRRTLHSTLHWSVLRCTLHFICWAPFLGNLKPGPIHAIDISGSLAKNIPRRTYSWGPNEFINTFCVYYPSKHKLLSPSFWHIAIKSQLFLDQNKHNIRVLMCN